MATIAEALAAAFDYHRAGRLAEAEVLYTRILDADPEAADAAHLLGVLYAQAGHPQPALALLKRAVTLRPEAASPNSNLGNALRVLGRTEAAVAAYARAVRLDPFLADAYANRAGALKHLRRAAAALPLAKRALAVAPDHAEALVALAESHAGVGQADAGAAAARRAAALRPDLAAAWLALGNAAAAGQRWAEAEAAYRAALDRAPNLVEAHENLGLVLVKQGREEEALDLLDAAGRLRPERPLWRARATALLALGRARDAAESYAREMEFHPADAGLHWNRAFALLLAGDMAEGWEEFEWRRNDDNAQPPWRPFPQPTWRGEDVQGRTLLLYAEQGLGDTIQFLRYVPMVAARGARIVLEVQPPLLPLLEGFPGVARVIGRGEPLPDFDLECPLMSLPRVFGTRVDSIPADVPYLRPDPARAAAWRERLLRHNGGEGPKVGLVWAGNPRFQADDLRSPRLSGLRAVLDVPGVRWFGLQMGDGRQDLERVPVPDGFTDLGGAIGDFADTAAIMANLDLVVSSCTSVAHLAGALGVPVWVALPFAPDWRWLLGRDDSPWYPTARLFRQERVGDWTGVARRIAAALAEMA
ncbi:tetratricopeptide repeat-containing glycosyltransferase family protein [Azospirillum sp.]|uniref:tetratricopeptide repeat-containing glycosyltransferase family protein n=1 Tax=Azospirillum sp. TaxID=34012 RepID=UPI002D6D4F25|nr:tetratricopeptide repeat-containing glycosyltransferase family protein [Azospirillum sp.]HYD71357.1 tetratricopeptide repeat-containing glycosyltransferase family protein [Azospirillum sp.]